MEDFSVVFTFLVNRIMGRSVTRKLFNSLGFCLPAVFLVLAGYSGSYFLQQKINHNFCSILQDISLDLYHKSYITF